jgi:hypothetical protein
MYLLVVSEPFLELSGMLTQNLMHDWFYDLLKFRVKMGPRINIPIISK